MQPAGRMALSLLLWNTHHGEGYRARRRLEACPQRADGQCRPLAAAAIAYLDMVAGRWNTLSTA